MPERLDDPAPEQPERGTIFPWLRVVAIHEAYRLSAIERRDTHLEAITTVVSWEEVIADPAAIDNALEAREALRVLAELPARQRDDLALFVAGYTYHEIAELTGGRTFTNVNKHLAKARARIRLAGFALPRSGAHDARVPRPGRNHPGGVQGRRAARLPRHPGRRRLSVSARLGQTSYKTRRARAPSLPANPV